MVSPESMGINWLSINKMVKLPESMGNLLENLLKSIAFFSLSRQVNAMVSPESMGMTWLCINKMVSLPENARK